MKWLKHVSKIQKIIKNKTKWSIFIKCVIKLRSHDILNHMISGTIPDTRGISFPHRLQIYLLYIWRSYISSNDLLYLAIKIKLLYAPLFTLNFFTVE